MGVLGTGENEAWIYQRGGTVPLGKVEEPESLEWNRELNSISEASVEVKTGTHGDCCGMYGQIGTWGFELVMFRDGKRCWEGPITNLRWRRGGVSILAKDVLGWTARTGSVARLITTPAYVEAEGWWQLQQAFLNSDPNVMANASRLATNTGPTVTRDIRAYVGYNSDAMTELVKSGLMFTTVGRRALVWHSDYVMGQTATLLPDHLSGEIEVEEDGMDLSVRSVFTNDDGVTGAYGTTPDSFYGDVQIIESSDGVDATSLTTAATTHRAQHYPAPIAVNVPQGSVLSCDAPFAIEELVAGSIVPVKVEGGICRSVRATQQLQSVKVSDGDGGEKVAITVTPASQLVTT